MTKGPKHEEGADVRRSILTSSVTQTGEEIESLASDESLKDMEKQLSLLERYLNELPDKLLGLGVRTVLALILFAIGSRLIAMIRHFIRRAMERSSASEEAAQFLDSSIKFVSYTILVFMILQLFGVEAASIATVIGSVGVTIGLAIQGSLSNCIGGILIMMLKPFHVGDYIIEGGGNEGIVQQISVFYTKLATYDNQIILIPNGNLANSSLTNVTDEAERRVDLKVGISYDSDIRSARKAVQEIAKKKPVCASGAGDHSQRRRTGRQQCCPCCEILGEEGKLLAGALYDAGGYQIRLR